MGRDGREKHCDEKFDQASYEKLLNSDNRLLLHFFFIFMPAYFFFL
jgi:hypothetical protein